MLALCAVIGQQSAAQAKTLQRPVVCTVQPGDSLWAISQRVHISTAKIEHLNHLTDSSILQPGENLVVGERSVVAVKHASRAAATQHHTAIRRTTIHRMARTTMSAI